MTKETRKLVTAMLRGVCKSAYYKKAPNENERKYPHIVFDIENVDLDKFPRKDQILVIDIWTKNSNEADDIADELEKIFDSANMPQEQILPTFYLISRKNVEDVDDTIERIEIKIQIQNYERKISL